MLDRDKQLNSRNLIMGGKEEASNLHISKSLIIHMERPRRETEAVKKRRLLKFIILQGAKAILVLALMMFLHINNQL
jgi:hypothetical protein